MEKIQAQVEQLASAVVLADPTDLPSLASIHTQFEQLAAQVSELAKAGEPSLPSPAVISSCDKAKKIVEAVVLRETDDLQAAIGSVRSIVADIQKAINATGAPLFVPETPIEAPAPAPAAAPAPSDHAEPLSFEESAIKSEDVPLVKDFITEAFGHIEAAEAALLVVEQNPSERSAIDAVFRAFHTVKGVAGFLGLKQIGTLAHHAESVLDLGRTGKLELTGEPIELILQAVDALKGLLASLDAAMKAGVAPAIEPTLPALIARFEDFKNGGNSSAPKPAVPATPAAPAASETPATDNPGFMVFDPLSPEEQAALHAAARAAATAEAAKTEITQALAKPETPATAAKTTPTGGEATVKVSTDRLDNLINAVGELVIAQAMVQQIMFDRSAAPQRLARNVTHLGKITRELQDLAMAMRMVPIQSVFQKMGRIVRDVAKKTGKEIDLVVEGGETELDRTLVESISDPLVHMVRNAADHGCETPADREKAGKPRTGKITLRACHQSGNILIEIRDDGKGLNKQRIVQKATQAGLVQPGQELADADIFRLIFHPGLSTAEKVTDVSGRGVGMDVVKKNVEALRGRVEITSVEGQGTSFIIRLPLTLAVIDGLLIRVGQERYILPILSVEQSIKPTAEQISTVQNKGEILNLRGQLLPLYRLGGLFGIQGAEQDATKALVIVVQDDTTRFGLVADELLGQHQVVIKSLGKGIGEIKGVSGASILGDGTVSLILDIPGIRQAAAGL